MVLTKMRPSPMTQGLTRPSRVSALPIAVQYSAEWTSMTSAALIRNIGGVERAWDSANRIIKTELAHFL